MNGPEEQPSDCVGKENNKTWTPATIPFDEMKCKYIAQMCLFQKCTGAELDRFASTLDEAIA